MTSPCGKVVELGGVASFPCSVDIGHDGPCASNESSVSQARRERWINEQRAQLEAFANSGVLAPAAPSPAPVDEQLTTLVLDSNIPQLTTHMIEVNAPGEREAAIIRRLTETSLEALPATVRSWMMGTLATTTMMSVWTLAHSEFDRTGQNMVVMTKDFLETLVPESLKEVFAQYQRGVASGSHQV